MVTREERRTEQRGLRRKASLLASIIAIIALVVGSLFGDRGILQLMAQRQRALELAREIEEVRAENLRLAAEIRALRTDPRAIERIAREQLGLARPGETVFLIRDADAPVTR
ncbi:MAG TPA: septum formation initiator family protein [Vicinamibacteria bacterium]|nr:septum formation initiator family protein [Vicinamibacteria bacterium]